MAEFVVNGDLSAGHADNWPAQATYHATGGPGGEAYVQFPAGQSSIASNRWTDLLPENSEGDISAGQRLIFSMWVKADIPGSLLYWEIGGNGPVDSAHYANQQGAYWQSVHGEAGNVYYPVSRWEVPTQWTLVVSSLAINNPLPFWIRTVYFNHVNGSERNAAISIANLSIRSTEPTLDSNMLSEGGGFENGLQGWFAGSFQGDHSRKAARSGEWGFRIDAPTVNQYPLSTHVDSGPGREYYVEYWARKVRAHEGAPVNSAGEPITPHVRVYYHALKVDGSVQGGYGLDEGGDYRTVQFDARDFPLNEWVRVYGYVTAPADTVSMRFGPHLMRQTATIDIDDVYVIDITNGWPTPASGATEVGVATVDRRGLVSETFARSREKINLQLAEPDERLKGGERIELAAFAASSSEVTWRWRQVTGPEVFLVREGNTCHFQAPDVDNLTDMRIAVTASSVDGANRADWHFFDLEIQPAAGRFAAEGSDGFLPHTPQMVGYNRGKREIWNDVIAPVGMDPEGRKEPKLVDLGIPADDVVFSLDGEEPARAAAGGVYVDLRDGAIYRNFGGGYNETDDTTGAPRLNAYMVNPATGEVFEWIEGADNGR